MAITEIQHDRKCLAAAVIAGVENFRDAEISYEEFRTGLDFALSTGYSYLADGTMTCICENRVIRDRINGIDPKGSYWAELKDWGTVGLVDGETARQMLRGSTDPDKLIFNPAN